MVANYTKKHVTFNKGQSIGHMELPTGKMSQTHVTVSSQKMMEDQIKLDTFMPPLHHLSWEVKWSLDELLKSFKPPFVKDETGIGMTNVTKMQSDTGNSDPVLQKPYPIAMKYYDRVKHDISKLLDAKVICSSHSRGQLQS